MNSRIEQMEAEANAMIQSLGQGNTAPATTNDESKNPAPAASETPAVEQEQKKPEQQPTSQENAESGWENRYRILQGKYNKEVGTWRDKVTQLEQDVNSLRQTNSDLTRKVSELEANKQPQSESEEDGYIASEFGGDFDKAVESKARKIAESMMQEANQKIDAVNKQFEQHSQVSRQQQLESMLSTNGISFTQVDSDPLFLDFLSEQEAYSGMTKHELLSSAYQQGDLQRVARFYIDYVQSTKQPEQPKSNPLEDNVTYHQQQEVPDSYSQTSYSPQQIGALIAQNEQALISGQVTQKEYEQKERELFGLLNS